MIGDLLKKIFGDKSTKDQKRYQPFVDQTTAFLAEIQQLSDNGLREKSFGFREKIKEAILEGKIANNYEEAYDLMLEKGEELGLTPHK